MVRWPVDICLDQVVICSRSHPVEDVAAGPPGNQLTAPVVVEQLSNSGPHGKDASPFALLWLQACEPSCLKKRKGARLPGLCLTCCCCWYSHSAVLAPSPSRRACGAGFAPTTAEHAASVSAEGDEEEEESIYGTMDQEGGEEEEEEEDPLDRWGTVILPDSEQM